MVLLFPSPTVVFINRHKFIVSLHLVAYILIFSNVKSGILFFLQNNYNSNYRKQICISGETCINYLVGQLSALSISSNIIRISETDDADTFLTLLVRANDTKLFTILNGNITEDLLHQVQFVNHLFTCSRTLFYQFSTRIICLSLLLIKSISIY